MIHYIYQLIDPITEEFYFGVRSHEDPSTDDYKGSMCTWVPEDVKRIQKIILCEFETREKANKCEQKIIKRHIQNPSNRNYNIPEIGFCMLGMKRKPFTKEHRRKLSENNLNNPRTYWKGKTRSEKTKQKISKALKGRKHSEETKKRLSIAGKGKKRSEETKSKISKNHAKYWKGKPAWNRKPVLQYTKNNEFIQEWPSIASVADGLNISPTSISKCCNNKTKSSVGYIWKFKIK